MQGELPLGKIPIVFFLKEREGGGSFLLAVYLSFRHAESKSRLRSKSIKTGMYLMAKFPFAFHCLGRGRGNKCHAGTHGSRS